LLFSCDLRYNFNESADYKPSPTVFGGGFRFIMNSKISELFSENMSLIVSLLLDYKRILVSFTNAN